MVDQDVVCRDRADHVAIVDGEMLEPRIRGFDENLRHISGGAQRPLNAENFMADRIAIAERREDLVDVRPASGGTHEACPTTAPAGIAASTLAAAGRSFFRRAIHPGSGSIVFVAVSFCSRSSISRYFRSITGHE